MKKYLLVTTFLLSTTVNAAHIWTGGTKAGESAHVISVFDSSGSGHQTVLTLEGFSHARCAGLSNRIRLKSDEPANAAKLSSIALGAFLSGAKVSLQIDDACVAERILLIK